MDFYEYIGICDDEMFITDCLIEVFEWAEMDGEEGIKKIYNNIQDRYKDNELINSCLVDCILERVKKCIEEYGNFNIAKAYLNLI